MQVTDLNIGATVELDLAVAIGSYSINAKRLPVVYQIYSYLAYKVFKEFAILGIHKSGAGWYIGTITQDGMPNTRDSGYYKSEEDALDAFEHLTWEQRLNS